MFRAFTYKESPFTLPFWQPPSGPPVKLCDILTFFLFYAWRSTSATV